jgi:hypothetical protein
MNQVREKKLEKMEDFERDALRVGIINTHETHRDPEDETKWTLQHMDRMFRLWQAGARYGQAQLNCFKENRDGRGEERNEKATVSL